MISQITSVWGGAPAPHQSTNLQTRVKLCPIEGEEKKNKKTTITTAFRGGQTSATLFMRLKTSARKKTKAKKLPHRKRAV